MFVRERRLSHPASTMRSSGSLFLLLLLWEALGLCSPQIVLVDYFEGNCGLFPIHYEKCAEPVQRFFYNVNTKKCESYTDYQCPMERNRYNTTEQCEEYCSPKNFCHLPPDPGRCRDNKRRWFFNPKTKCCKSFIFNGCGGNANNFQRKWLCERICR